MAAVLIFVTILMVQSGVSMEVVRGSQAPPPRDPRAAPATGTGVIKGRVTAADTGAPIRRAIVQVSGGSRPRGVYTDEDGRYVLEELPPGIYVVSANPGIHRAGYRSLTLGMDPNAASIVTSPRRLEVANGQVVENIDFALPRGGAITGRVTDPYGDPAARVQVRALMVRAGSEPTQGGPGASTDDLGQFRIFGLTPGDYLVVAEPQAGGGPVDVDGPRIGLARTFAPGTHNRDQATRMRLRAGAEMAVDIRLLETPVFTIRGTVLNSSGEPVRNAGVTLMRPDEGPGAIGGGLDPSGQFTLRNVAPGTYDLVANYMPPNVRPDGNGRMEGREMAIVRVDVASADIEGLVVTTSPGATFTGQIVYDEPAPEGMRAQINLTAGQQRMFGSIGRVEVKGDTFTVHETFGRVLLRGNAGSAAQTARPVAPSGGLSPAIDQPRWSVKHVLLNGKDITDIPTEFSAAHSGRVQVVFTSRAPSLEGTVVNESGQPARATILVFSVDEETWTANSSRIRSGPVIGDDGKFVLRGLRAGRYYAAAVPAGPLAGSSAPDREFLRALKATATEVMLNEGETRTVDLRLIRVE
jgi:hypothetical protein